MLLATSAYSAEARALYASIINSKLFFVSDLANNDAPGTSKGASTTANLRKLEHLLKSDDLSDSELDIAIHTDITEPEKHESPTTSGSPV